MSGTLKYTPRYSGSTPTNPQMKYEAALKRVVQRAHAAAARGDSPRLRVTAGYWAPQSSPEVIAEKKHKAFLLRRLWRIEDCWKRMQAKKAAALREADDFA